MSVSIDSKNGVRVKTAQKPGRIVAVIIIALEAIFSVFLYMSLAERVFVVLPAAAAPGVPELIAYQGLLTDTSGNPLGGAGSIYCFRYSIWDAQSAGSQLWPQPALGDASTTPSNSTTTVTDGVFSDNLGRKDTFGNLDFGADTTGSSTYFLQVQVSTSSLTCATGLETLTPRQQITSDAWSQTAQSVYGNQLRTLINNNTVQIGTGGGVASGTQTLLSLDVVNTGDTIGGSCSQNGTLWYDSTLKVALVCANNLVQPFSNGTSSINSFGTSATTTLITAGEALLSAGPNITLNQSGNTITISGASAGSLATFISFQNRQLGASLATTAGQNTIWLTPFYLAGGDLSGSTIQLLQSFGGASSSVSQSWGETISWALYSNPTTNSTLFSTFTTGSYTMSISESSASLSYGISGTTSSSAATALFASISGARILTMSLGSLLTPGLYAFGYGVSTASAGANAIVSTSGIYVDNPLASQMGSLPGALNSTIGYGDAGTLGSSTAMPATFALTAIGQISNRTPYFRIGEL